MSILAELGLPELPLYNRDNSEHDDQRALLISAQKAKRPHPIKIIPPRIRPSFTIPKAPAFDNFRPITTNKIPNNRIGTNSKAN